MPRQRTQFGPFRRRTQVGVPADRLPRGGGIAPFGDGVRSLIASGTAALAAMPVHHTGTSDSAWDGPANEKNLSTDDGEAEYKKAYAWQDGDADPDTKAAYSFIHHFVDGDGKVGDASTKACSSTVAILNGGRGVDVKSADWFSDRTGIYKHVAAHLSDSGVEKDDLPELDDMAVVERRMAIWERLAAIAPFEVSSAAEGLIVQIDACVDELMEELGIPDEDDDDDMAARLFASARWHSLLLLAALAGSRKVISIAEMRAALGLDPGVEPLGAVHPPFTGRHSHPHSAMGAQGDDDTHDHSHTHDGDAAHDHPHSAASFPLTHGHDPALEITDPARLSLLLASAAGVASMDQARERLAAARQAAGITAAVKPDGTVEPAPWHSYLCVEGIRTDDGRELTPGCCLFPDLPVSLRLLIEDEGGHWGAVTCGRIDTMERVDLPPLQAIYSEGIFGSDDNGQLGELMVREQTQRFVSIDPRPDFEGEIIYITVERQGLYEPIAYDSDCDAVVDCWLQITRCTIGAATIVPMPAYPQAVITLADVPLPEAPIANATAPPGLPGPAEASVAAAAAPVRPPKAWFADPGFHVGDPRLVVQEDGRSYACPLTVTDDGQVYGHIAWWNCRHTGFMNKTVKPPRSKTGYSYYRTGPGVACDDGWVEGVGQVTMGCGHADPNVGWQAAVAHYDGGYGAVAVADVVCGQDDFGPWIAGALKPGLSDEQVRDFRALSLSGDWREAPIAGGATNLELVAVLAVPVPGFPVRRSLAASAETIQFAAVRAGMHGERMVSLVAAGRVVRMTAEQRLERLEHVVSRQAAVIEQLSNREKQRILGRIS